MKRNTSSRSDVRRPTLEGAALPRRLIGAGPAASENAAANGTDDEKVFGQIDRWRKW
jgi:hypothetical protein